jgi:RNA polymerase sigma factor (sigma-70 family)
VGESSKQLRAADAAVIASAYERAGAERWALGREEFADAIRRVADADRDLAAVTGSPHLADFALAAACRAGKPAAWDHFVEKFRPILYASARAISGEESHARELADALYAELYGLEVREGRRRSLFDYFAGRSSLATWLRAILAQRHVDYFRAARKLEPLDNRSEPISSAEQRDPDRARYVAAVGAALGRALAMLDARDRMRLGYYYREQMKLRAIGKIMHESESTASRNLDRTRAALRFQIERALKQESNLTGDQIRLCYSYAAEDLSIDLRTALPEAATEPPR